MPAVMGNDEYPDQEPSGQHRQRHRQPPGYLHGKVHQTPQRHIRHKGVEDLPHGRPPDRLLVLGHDVFPCGPIGLLFSFGASSRTWVWMYSRPSTPLSGSLVKVETGILTS